MTRTALTRKVLAQNALAKPVTVRPNRPDAIAMLAAMTPSATGAPKSVASPITRQKIRQAKPGARAGTRQIAGHFPDSTIKALKFLIAEEDTTLQALLDGAISDLLVKKGRTKFVHA